MEYLWIIGWIVVAYILTKILQPFRIEFVDGTEEVRYKLIWVVLMFLPLIIWAGRRGDFVDTEQYRAMFSQMPYEWSKFSEFIATQTKDQGFYAVSFLIKCFITQTDVGYFTVIAALEAIPLILIYRKYSPSFITSFFLFIASTDYLSWMFNGIRQFMAVGITFLCFPLILHKKYVPTIAVILFASLFHRSALLMIPFIFIVQGKAWNKKTIMFMLAAVVAVVFIDRFTDYLDAFLQDTQYQNVVSDWKSWNDNGTSALRVLVYSVPAIISFFGVKYINIENNRIVNLCANMSIVSVGFYIVSMFTSGIFIGRLPIYFSLYSYILLPWELENMFNNRSRDILVTAMIGAYIVFYLYGLRTWGVLHL